MRKLWVVISMLIILTIMMCNFWCVIYTSIKCYTYTYIHTQTQTPTHTEWSNKTKLQVKSDILANSFHYISLLISIFKNA